MSRKLNSNEDRYVCPNCGKAYHISNGDYCPYCDESGKVRRRIFGY